MSEEVENALKLLEMDMLDNESIETLLKYIQQLQKDYIELDKENRKLREKNTEKDKVIDEMAEYINEIDIDVNSGFCSWRDKEQIKNSFYKRVEEEGE